MRTVGLILATVLMGTVSAAWWRNLNPPESAYGMDSRETSQVDVAALEALQAVPRTPLSKPPEPQLPASQSSASRPPLALPTSPTPPTVQPNSAVPVITGQDSDAPPPLPPNRNQPATTPASVDTGNDTSARETVVFEPRLATALVSDRAEMTVWFELDQATLVPAARQRLAELVAKLDGAQEILQIVVDGHCDDSGSDEYNQILSEQRAAAVMTFLNAEGIKGNKQIVRGFGERLPVAAGNDEASRRRNRRAEIRIDWVQRQTLDTAGMPDVVR